MKAGEPRTDKKLTPQILAMYLGCTVRHRSKKETLVANHNRWTEWMELTPWVLHCCRDHEVQIQLRRLEDMTEEEAVSMYNELYPKSSLPEQYKAGTIKQQLGKDGISSEGYGVSIHDYVTWFPMLLSKSFDLFGLIDNNEAIDQKTLTA